MKRILSLTGKMGAGKSTVLAMLEEMLPRKQVLVKFAGPLYDIQDYVYWRAGLTLEGPKDRKLLQWLGTEWGRSKDENLWVNIFARDARRALEDNPTCLVVNDDCRYENEAETLGKMDAILVRVETDDDVRGSRIPLENQSHASEQGVPEYFIDHYLVNNGSREDLRKQVRVMIAKFNL